MTCRHAAGDTACSSHPDNVELRQYEYEREQAEAKLKKAEEEKRAVMTPDSKNYEITEVARIGPHLVLRVKYPNCSACAYEGNKVMVFLDVEEVAVLKWRVIDPHFRDPRRPRVPGEAPSPAARFPASPDGWEDAIGYARGRASKAAVR